MRRLLLAPPLLLRITPRYQLPLLHQKLLLLLLESLLLLLRLLLLLLLPVLLRHLAPQRLHLLPLIGPFITFNRFRYLLLPISSK